MDKSKLIEDHLVNVKNAAYHYYKFVPDGKRGTVTIEDLISAGNVGLVEAASKFKEGGEAKFSTYAYQWIKGAIFAELNFYIGSRALLLDDQTTDAVISKQRDSEDVARDLYNISDIPAEKQVRIITAKLEEFGLCKDEIVVYLATHGVGSERVTNMRYLARKLGKREMDIRRISQSAERKIRKEYFDA